MDFAAFRDELTKIAFDWHKFREGVSEEGVPLAGATLGAGIGSLKGRGLTGAALGYALGGGIQMARSKMKGEKPSAARKLLAGTAIGYGLGGVTHAGIGKLLTKFRPKSRATPIFNDLAQNAPKRAKLLHGLTEEAFPAAGATIGAGVAMGSDGKKKKNAR